MKLYPFQEVGVSYLRARSKVLLADEMGLGKTPQAILAAKEKAGSKLVLCPASVKYNWLREINQWWPGQTIHIIEGRSGSELPITDWTIVNYDLLITKKTLLQILKRQWGVLILDEAHFLKNSRAKRTKAVYYPKGIAERADNVWLLTGTPVLNRPIELYTHLKALIPERLGRYVSRHEFSKHFCAGHMGKWGWDETGASNLDELAKILDGFMLRREKKDVLKDLPDKTYQTIYLEGESELIQRERRAHEKTKESILGDIASIRREIGVRKVAQVAEHLENVLEERPKLVLFAYHRDVIGAYRRRFSACNPAVITGSTPAKQRQAEVDRFRTDDSCRLFIGQIEAAGTGIDGLQDVCDTVIFAEMSYVPGQISQAIDRCHRIGQRKPVLVQFMVMEGSIDEDIAMSISRKEKVIERIVRKTPETTRNEKEESDMSMENELKRIADSLERIEARMSGLPVAPHEQAVVVPLVETIVDKGKPAEKRKATKAVPEAVIEGEVDFGEGEPAATPVAVAMTPAEFLKEANTHIIRIKDAAKRTVVVNQLKAMFQKDYGVTSVMAIPVDKVDECYAKFEKIMKMGV